MRTQNVPKLGVGINYHPRLHHAVQALTDHIDYLEVSPDVLCDEKLSSRGRYLELNESMVSDLHLLAQDIPVVVHGLGLSIASASGWNQQYLEMLESFLNSQPAQWHSEHLGFTLVKDEQGREQHAGVLLPVNFTEEALNILVPRVQRVQELIPLPFLLENTTAYLPELQGSRWDEVGFLNELTSRSGCGLILDLYNFYCNAMNFGFDPYSALAALDFSVVQEVHIAGGMIHRGFHLDVHSDVVTEDVWQLLQWALPKIPNLGGITFEILEQSLLYLSEDQIASQLERAHTLWLDYLANNKQVVGL